MPFGFNRRFRIHKVGMLSVVPLLAACAVPVATVEVEPSVVAGNTLAEASGHLRLAGNSGTTQSVLEHLAGDHSEAVRIQVAANPNTPAAALERLAKDRSKDVRIAVYENPQSSAVIRTIALGQAYGGSNLSSKACLSFTRLSSLDLDQMRRCCYPGRSLGSAEQDPSRPSRFGNLVEFIRCRQ